MTFEGFYKSMIERHKNDAAKMQVIEDIEQDILWDKGAIVEKIEQQFPNNKEIWSDSTDKGFAFSEQYLNYVIAYAEQIATQRALDRHKSETKSMREVIEKISDIINDFSD